MRGLKGSSGLKRLARFALVGLIGGTAAGCSDSLRLSDPLSNPFSSSSRVGGEPGRTGSLAEAPRPAPAMRTAAVQTQPLAAPSSLPPASAPMPRPAPPTGGPAGWTARGGTPIVVGSSDSLDIIAGRYGVPPAAILSANGLKSAGQVAPGRTLVIPVYNAGEAGGAATPRPGRVASAAPVPPQTQFRLVEGAKPAAQSRAAAQEESELKRLRERVARLEAEKGGKGQVPGQKLASFKAEPAKPEPVRVARLDPAKAAARAEAPARSATAAAAKPAPEPARPAPKEPEQTASLAAKPGEESKFRWPARGRVISGYGSSGNEGINIALPDGTPVKAAEEGTVAYAGSDVKGYGNLVLVRHPNGFVSAYAHNGEINVKPGEKVKRGQVIAKSGQTGNVTSPQLHFEIRKGATPVDPMPHLASN